MAAKSTPEEAAATWSAPEGREATTARSAAAGGPESACGTEKECASAAGCGSAETNGLEKCGPAADCGSAVGCRSETCRGGWLNASATTLAVLDVWRKYDVNSERYAICRCCRADQGGVTHAMAATNGLWSVKRRKWRPSKRKRKCQTAENTACNSWSNVE